MTTPELNTRGREDFLAGKRDEALYSGFERANEAYRYGWQMARIRASMQETNPSRPIPAPLPAPASAAGPVLPNEGQGSPKATEPATDRGTAEPQLDLFG